MLMLVIGKYGMLVMEWFWKRVGWSGLRLDGRPRGRVLESVMQCVGAKRGIVVADGEGEKTGLEREKPQ